MSAGNRDPADKAPRHVLLPRAPVLVAGFREVLWLTRTLALAVCLDGAASPHRRGNRTHPLSAPTGRTVSTAAAAVARDRHIPVGGARSLLKNGVRMLSIKLLAETIKTAEAADIMSRASQRAILSVRGT